MKAAQAVIVKPIEDFEYEDEIGSGGFANVSLVREKETQKLYAMKTIVLNLSLPDMNKMIEREFEVPSRLNFPSIIRPYCLIDTGDCPRSFLFEFMRNGSLSDVIKKESRGAAPSGWNATQKSIVLFGVLCGLQYLHQMAVIHRDIKADNILLDNNLEPYISDFGICQIGEESGNQIGAGNVRLCSPEILAGLPIDDRVDVYGVGMILYHMATLKEPYSDGGLSDVITQKMQGKLPDTINIQSDHLQLVSWCAYPEPGNRVTLLQIIEEMHRHRYLFDGTDYELFDKYSKRLRKCLSEIGPRSVDESLFAIKEDAEKGNPISQYYYWMNFFLINAALSGFPDAQYSYGVSLRRGIDVATDPVEAISYLLKVERAKNCMIKPQLEIEECFYSMIETVGDPGAVTYYYKIAGDTGRVSAKASFGMSLIKGNGVAKDIIEGIYNLLYAAFRGIDSAIAELPKILYDFDIGWSTEFVKAMAVRGEPYRYAKMLHYGDGVALDDVESAYIMYESSLNGLCKV